MELLPLLLLPLLMYFLLIRPQQKKLKAQQAMLSAVKEGDEIMTAGGIFGYVNAIEGDVLWLEVAENTTIRVTKGAVARVVTSTPAADTTDVATPKDEGPIVGGAPDA